ncbi:MAG: hypothetical protein WCV69_03805 [Patescibacteria group bacterium]|jgi:hypothetical protein
MAKRRSLHKADVERHALHWVGNCSDEEIDGMVDIIDEATPKCPKLSVKLQRCWVINQLILREVVINRGTISQEPKFQKLMTVFRMSPREIDRRLTAVYELAKRHQHRQPAA